MFLKLNLSSGEVKEISTRLGPLERSNLNRWSNSY
jgi:hypothetical protein